MVTLLPTDAYYRLIISTKWPMLGIWSRMEQNLFLEQVGTHTDPQNLRFWSPAYSLTRRVWTAVPSSLPGTSAVRHPVSLQADHVSKSWDPLLEQTAVLTGKESALYREVLGPSPVLHMWLITATNIREMLVHWLGSLFQMKTFLLTYW